MDTQEFVEHFVKSVKTKVIKCGFGILATDAVAVLIAYFMFMKFANIENDNMLYVFLAVIIVIFYLSFFINVKLCFHSFKNFKKQSDISDRYNKLLKEYRKTNNKEAFDQALSELETAIKRQ